MEGVKPDKPQSEEQFGIAKFKLDLARDGFCDH